MRLARFARRSLAVTAAALIAATTFAPVDADARAGRGGSFGSRGSRTFDAPPPTATAPGAQQMQRTQTQPNAGAPNPGASGAQRPATQGQQPGRFGGMFGGGLMGGIMGGLLGAGLFGLLTGSGFLGGLGSLASLLGLVIQVVLVVLIVRFAINWFRRRQAQGSAAPSAPYRQSPYQPSPAGVGAGQAPRTYQPAPANDPGPIGATSATSDRFDQPSGSSGNGYGGGYQSAPSGEVTIETSDYDAFERMLRDVQDAWSRQDMGALRAVSTPEMYQMFTDDLAEMSSEGVVNRVSDVKLLQGDLAEAWSENGEDFATVAMRYELIDVTEDARTREVVDGDPTRPTEATELWTFVRPAGGGDWRLSAVQQAEEKKQSSGWFG